MSNLRSRLSGKTVLVTAAAAGIGRASVLRMASEGARVIATDVDEGGLSEISNVASVEIRRLDVTDVAAVRKLAADCATVNVLFNCVGMVHNGTVLDCSEDQWERALAVNVTSCFHMISVFLPGMLEQRSGSIINMSSIVSSLKGAPNRFSYMATKAAIIGITKSVAVDFVGQGIRCNAICPGTVDTASLQQRLHATGDYVKARQEFEARQPMKRLARAEEIAALVAYLASDDAGFITGQAYPIDGGWSI